MERPGTIHRALDIPAPAGTPVLAVAPGVVVKLIQSSKDAGKYVTIRHEVPGIGGMLSRSLHLKEINPDLRVGMSVKRGQPIGTVGMTGTKYNHLHFDLWVCNARSMANYRNLFGSAKGLEIEKANVGQCARVPSEPLIPVDAYTDQVRGFAQRNGVPLYGVIKLPAAPSNRGAVKVFALVAGVGAALGLWYWLSRRPSRVSVYRFAK
jgi:murein DD-endopeptidase MepM/ murein hydrolase activator NlpD